MLKFSSVISSFKNSGETSDWTYIVNISNKDYRNKATDWSVKLVCYTKPDLSYIGELSSVLKQEFVDYSQSSKENKEGNITIIPELE